MGDSRDVLNEMEATLKQVEVDLKKGLVYYDAVCKERGEYRKTIILQGEEVERLKAEVDDLKMTEKVYLMNKDWIADAKVEIQSLKEKLDKAVEALEKCEDGTLAAWEIGCIAADVLKLIKGGGE